MTETVVQVERLIAQNGNYEVGRLYEVPGWDKEHLILTTVNGVVVLESRDKPKGT